MHEIVQENLEEVLRVSRDRLPGEVKAHLSACAPCRELLDAMREQSGVLASLRGPAELDPTPGFYARVMARVESEARPSIWDLFLDPFGRRLTYAAATLLVLLGTYIVTSETAEESAYHAPEAILIDRDEARPLLGEDQQRDRNTLLVNLATYEESYQ
jgi:predicted anti-sigma-YlaC factor YlaD